MLNIQKVQKSSLLHSSIYGGPYCKMLAVVLVKWELCGFDIHGSVHRKRIFKHNQQDAPLHNLFISVKCYTHFRRFLCPSSGAHNCIYSIGYFVKPLLLAATVVEELELHVEHFTEINKLCNGASCWLCLKISCLTVLIVAIVNLYKNFFF